MYFLINNFIQNKLLLIYNYKNIQEILKFKKIILQFSLKNSLVPKKIIAGFLILSILSNNKKSLIFLSKKTIMTLKVKKGMPVSCKVTLRKKQMFLFLNLFNLINIYKLKSLWSCKSISIKTFTLTLRISELYSFPNLEKFFEFFEDISNIEITFVLKSTLNLNLIKKFFSLSGILKD